MIDPSDEMLRAPDEPPGRRAPLTDSVPGIVDSAFRDWGRQWMHGTIISRERMFEDWLAKDEDLRKMNAGDLRRDFSAVRLELEQSSEILFKNFLRISGLLK